ncbi:unnamed protein product [Phytophthora fragariaefolia]|uniref:Unnamed protein product n=1 Tax=Phytophthora fragariaefolia TaxID=1490495 RepID=A0A9W6YQI7_9STRA|nr:unnamed protein product [Phytophthora fragariaefolia]
MKSGRVLVSRDAQFMEDVFDGGRRRFDQEEAVVELRDEVATDQEASSGPEEDADEKEAARDEDSEPGSKRHQRTRSLEEAVEIPRSKRHSRQLLSRRPLDLPRCTGRYRYDLHSAGLQAFT